MRIGDEHTDRFIQAIERGESIKVSRDGTWCKRWRITALLRRLLAPIFRWNDTINVAETTSFYLLKASTKTTAGFLQRGLDPERVSSIVTAVKKTIEAQKKKGEEKLKEETAKTFRSTVLSSTSSSQEKKRLSRPPPSGARAIVARLDRANLTNHYLGISQQKIEASVPQQEDINWVREKLLDWQVLQSPKEDFFCDKSKEGTKNKIEHCCKYTKFIEACREDEALLEQLFYSAFYNLPADCNSAVDLFIQAPHIEKTLQRTFLDKRIKTVENQGLRFIGGSSERKGKDVQLLVNGIHQSIVDPERNLTIALNVTRKVKDIFKTFEEHVYKICDLEYLQDGICLFDSQLPGFDFSPGWWKRLPIVEKVTREEIERRYGNPDNKTPIFKTGEAFVVLRASRTTPDFNVDGCHVWQDIALPLGDGNFNLLSVSKFATYFPRGLLEAFGFIFKTQKATITVVDSNKFMNSRERIAVPFPPLSQEKFESHMKNIACDIQKAHEGRLIFQAQGDNCTTWNKKVLKYTYDHFSITKFFKTEFSDLVLPNAIIMFLIRTQGFVPTQTLKKAYRLFLSTLFGASFGIPVPDKDGIITTKRLTQNRRWNKGFLLLPAALFNTADSLKEALRLETAL